MAAAPEATAAEAAATAAAATAASASADVAEPGVDQQDQGEVRDATEQAWAEEQARLRQQLSTQDCFQRPIKYVAGVDISFVKESASNACAALIVMELDTWNVVYKRLKPVRMTLPYITGFLAFREVDILVTLFNELRSSDPSFMPDVVMVDGNGVLHRRGFGLASHLGVLIGIPTIGLAKKWYQCSDLDREQVRQQAEKCLLRAGDSLPLTDSAGTVWGAALRSTLDVTSPIYVSIGHRISLDTAVQLVSRCCKFRVPEPVRQADLQSREWLRDNAFPSDLSE